MVSPQGAELANHSKTDAQPKASTDGGVLHIAGVFGESLFRSAIQDPYDGLAQLVNEGGKAVGAGSVLPELHVVSAAESAKLGSGDWFAQTLGSGLGMVAPFLLTDHLVGKAIDRPGGLVASLSEQGGLAAKIAPLVRPTLSGAAYGMVFTPTDNSGNFFEQRAVNAVVGGATFGTLRAASIGLMNGASALGLPVADSLFQKSAAGAATRISANLLAGGFAGGVNAEASSLLNGRGLASGNELANSVGAFVVTGGALDALHLAGGAMKGTGSAESRTTNPAQTVEASPSTALDAEKAQTAGGGSGHMMDVQARMTEDFSDQKANSPELKAGADALKTTVDTKLASLISDPSELANQKAQFQGLIDALAVREYDGVGMNRQHLIETYGAVDRLLNASKTAVDLTAGQRIGLAKQLLAEATNPYQAQTGANNTREAQGVQSLLLDRVPGKLTSGIVDLVTTGKYSTNRAVPINVDLTGDTLQKLPQAYANPLAPDAEALKSLNEAATTDGNLIKPDRRTYASQLAQTLINNIHTQGMNDTPIVYTKGAIDQSIAGDTGERLFALSANGASEPVVDGRAAVVGANLKTPDLQPLFDHVSGIDNDSLVLKNNNYFMVMNTDGTVNGNTGEALSRFGLYANDMRFVSNWDFRVNGQSPELTSADLSKGYAGKLQYELSQRGQTSQSGEALANGDATTNGVGIARDVVINNGIGERLTVTNNSELPQTVHLTYGLGADFRDMFEVRGWQRAQRGDYPEPVVSPPGGKILLSYKGLDGSNYSTDIGVNANGAPVDLAKDGVHFTLSLPPGGEHTVELSADPAVDRATAGSDSGQTQAYADRLKEANQAYETWRANTTQLSTGNEEFNRLLDRAYRDLYMLKIQTPKGDGIAAGIPWYVAGFGRDQLITSMQTLPFMPDLAKGVIEQLANYQGTKDDPATAQKPGKIMHELRAGEMARNGEIPFTPYYGTVDATPLWLMLLGRYVDTTGDTALAARMQPHIDAALQYLDAETARNGYLNYGGNGREALSNQGWKDSGDSIMHKDGTLVKAPITLSEPQGYLYSAWRAAAKMAEQSGDQAKADSLNAKADNLKERFNQDFWMPEENFAAIALDGNGQQAKVISSNPGHLISTGLLTPEHAFAVESRLMQGDMFSGYGIRTLSSNEARYNPGSYHDGTIWPHDNGMIGEGIHDLVPGKSDGNQLMMSLFDAARHYPEMRLPELFDGFPREQYPNPLPYPETSSPQAWAAGSMLQLFRSNLGVHADAANNRLLVFKPSVAPELGYVTMNGLRVGENKVDLRFARQSDGSTTVDVLNNPGNVNVKLEQ